MDGQKIFVYENIDGDSGMIISDSLEKAEGIFKEKYPNVALLNTDKPGVLMKCENVAYVYEFEHSEIKPDTLYILIPL